MQVFAAESVPEHPVLFQQEVELLPELRVLGHSRRDLPGLVAYLPAQALLAHFLGLEIALRPFELPVEFPDFNTLVLSTPLVQKVEPLFFVTLADFGKMGLQLLARLGQRGSQVLDGPLFWRLHVAFGYRLTQLAHLCE